MKEQYDIVIIGAGTSGCITAKYLSKDYKVLLIDKNNFPRNKACGGLLVDESKEVIEKLKLSEEIFSTPKILKLKYIDLDNNLGLDTNRDFLNISRDKFDNWLFETVKDKVDLSLNTKFLKFKENKNDLVVFAETNNSKLKFKTKYLISAEGSNSKIRNSISK